MTQEMFKYLDELERKRRNVQVPETKLLKARVCDNKRGIPGEYGTKLCVRILMLMKLWGLPEAAETESLHKARTLEWPVCKSKNT